MLTMKQNRRRTYAEMERDIFGVSPVRFPTKLRMWTGSDWRKKPENRAKINRYQNDYRKAQRERINGEIRSHKSKGLGNFTEAHREASRRNGVKGGPKSWKKNKKGGAGR